MTSNLGTQAQVHLGISRDRPGPGLTELFGPGWGPGQAQEPLPFWQAVATACLDFWTLLGGLVEWHPPRQDGEEPEGWPLQGWSERSIQIQPAACPCPLPSFKEDI